MKRTGLALTLLALAPACARSTPTPRAPEATPWRPRSGPSLDALLNIHRAWAPSPSPDGAQVAFLSDASGLPQAHATPVGAEPATESSWRRLVTATERVQYVAWSPDGQWVFTGRDQGGNENTRVFRQPAAGGDPVGITPEGAKTLFGAVSPDGRLVAYSSNERDAAHFDVYVRPAGEGNPRRVVEATGHREAPAFSRDGRRLAVVEEHSSFDQDLYVVDVGAGTTARVSPRTTDDVRFANPRFTADGSRLFVVSDMGREFMNVALVPSDRPPPDGPRFVLSEEHDVEGLDLSPAGDVLAVVWNVDGYGQLRLYDAGDPERPAERARPTLPAGEVSSLNFSRDGRWLFVDLSRATSGTEVYRVEVATGAATQVTASDRAGVDTGALVEPTVEHVRSFDGVDVPVFLFRPRDLGAGERAPVVVWVHGGPESQFTPYFNPVIQYLVGHGYIVAAPNVRGSTGYGKRYAHLDDVARREDSVRDLAAVNQWLRARPDVRGDRIAVLGGSYGGYMVLAALTLNPELWAAGCDIVGIANFETFLERTAAYRRALREAEYGTLANDREVLRRVSPIHRVDRIRAPLFVIHGANDPRVPVHEAEQIVAALRGRGSRVEYIRFENEGHGIFRRENRIRAYGELVTFFDQVLGAP